MEERDVAEFWRQHAPAVPLSSDLIEFRRRVQARTRRRALMRVAAVAAFVSIVGAALVSYSHRRDTAKQDKLQTAANVTVTSIPVPATENATSLVGALAVLGRDAQATPPGLRTDLPFCGIDRHELLQAPTRRCLLDAHVARYPSTMLIVQADALKVLASRYDGRIESYTLELSDRAQTWSFDLCERLTTGTAAQGADPTNFDVANCDSGGSPESIVRSNPPTWFLQREVLALCGFEVRVEQDRIETQRQCFRDAYQAGRPAEFAFGAAASGEIASASLWFRVLSANEYEILVRQEPRSSPPVNGEPFHSVWIQYRCSSLEFTDALPRLVPADCRILNR